MSLSFGLPSGAKVGPRVGSPVRQGRRREREEEQDPRGVGLLAWHLP